MPEEKDRQIPSPGNPGMDPASLGSLGFKVPERQTTMLGTDVSSLSSLTSASQEKLLSSAISSSSISASDASQKYSIGGSWKLGSNPTIGASWSLGTEAGKSVKTELASASRRMDGGGAKSKLRARISNFSSFGRGTPYGDYLPEVVKSKFYKEVVGSIRNFVPEYGLFGGNYSGGPVQIMPLRFQGAHPMMNVQQYDAASAASTFHNGEDEE